MLRTSDALWGREGISTHLVRATPETVQWGAFDASVTPGSIFVRVTWC